MPAGILAGLISKECGGVYSLTDSKVLQYSKEDAQVPHTVCADSPAGAHGPAQFLLSTFRQNGKYHQAYNIAHGTNRSTNVHNLADSVFASAWYLKCLQIAYTNPTSQYRTACNSGDFSEVPFDVTADDSQKLEPDDVYPFLAAYAGFRKDGDVDVQGCLNQSYCRGIYSLYEDMSDTGAISGDPWGWPTTGTISQGPYTGGSGGSHGGRAASAVDIANPSSTKVYASQDGRVYLREEKTQSGAYTGCGIYVEIVGPFYRILYCHLQKYSQCVIDIGDGGEIKTGTLLGYMNSTGTVVASGGGDPSHLHYSIRDRKLDLQLSLEEFNSLLPPYELNQQVTSSYSGEDC
jgi:murein DD-endopeptidase MepM/ murein hydrolase activator NlpD